MVGLLVALVLAQSDPNSSQTKYKACLREVRDKTQSCYWKASQIAKPDDPKYKANLDHCLRQVDQYNDTKCVPLLFKDK